MSISKEIAEIVEGYDRKSIAIGTIGSHSAIPIATSAKRWKFETIAVVEKGRDILYTKYNNWLFDEVIFVDRFQDVLREKVQERIRKLNTIWIPNRSFAYYVGKEGKGGYEALEKKFRVPIFGSRFLLKTEERDCKRGQFFLLEKAGIPTTMPKRFSSPEEIDRLVIVKIPQTERADFYVVSAEDFYVEARERIKIGLIKKEDLEKATIEEFIVGARFNGIFYSFSQAFKNTFGNFELVGFSDRIQTNLQGILNLPAAVQLKLKIAVTDIEVGHIGVTIRESLQPFVWKAAESLLRVCKKEYPPGILGLFGLQGAIARDEKTGKLKFVIFDISFRVTGDPCIGPTSPEMPKLSLKYGLGIIDPLDLTMMEIKKAIQTNRLSEIVT